MIEIRLAVYGERMIREDSKAESSFFAASYEQTVPKQRKISSLELGTMNISACSVSIGELSATHFDDSFFIELKAASFCETLQSSIMKRNEWEA